MESKQYQRLGAAGCILPFVYDVLYDGLYRGSLVGRSFPDCVEFFFVEYVFYCVPFFALAIFILLKNERLARRGIIALAWFCLAFFVLPYLGILWFYLFLVNLPSVPFFISLPSFCLFLLLLLFFRGRAKWVRKLWFLPAALMLLKHLLYLLSAAGNSIMLALYEPLSAVVDIGSILLIGLWFRRADLCPIEPQSRNEHLFYD